MPTAINQRCAQIFHSYSCAVKGGGRSRMGPGWATVSRAMSNSPNPEMRR